MKEKWIKKLIRLLNKYEEWKSEKYIHWNYVWWYDEDIWCIFASRFPDNTFISFDESIAIIICKWYNFIKWLFDNNKIDRHSERLELDMKRMRIPQDYYIGWLQSLDLQHKKAQYLSLIALLSIQDDPVNYLIRILK